MNLTWAAMKTLSLRSTGVVLAEHQRQKIYYRVANQKLSGVCDLMREVLEEQAFMKPSWHKNCRK